MEITWLGHSCFRIKGKEVILVVDPHDASVGYPAVNLTAHIVMLSHDHPGHNYVDGIEGNPYVIRGVGEYEVQQVFITGIPTFHDLERGSLRGKNVIYVVEIEGIRLCHLGDVGQPISSQQVEEIGRVDILMIPVGGVSTLSIKSVVGTVNLLNPQVVIPMHYNAGMTPRLEQADKFFKEFGLGAVTPQSKLTITAATLPTETQVVELEYQGT